MSGGRDLRVDGTRVKDQGRRGTCVSCAATAAHELTRCDGTDLSIEFLHWASKLRDSLPPRSEGTTLPASKAALGDLGQPPEVTWPYDEARDQWAADYQPPQDAKTNAEQRRVNGGELFQPTVSLIHDALDQGRPVVLGLRLYATWHGTAGDGYIAMPLAGSMALGGHAIVVVGYDGSHLIIQNSWGSEWGDRGFGYLPNEYVDQFGLVAWSLAI